MTLKTHTVIKRQNPQNRFYAVVVAGLLMPAFPLSALAAGIAAVSGSGTTVNTQNGVPVVAIATPSANGLSHNRYTDFNVGAQGAVLNNSLAAGASQLAGQVGANANLQGRNARVILNEVVSANSSQLLGQQEVFGQRAELILANPNGISCNSCGFINVSQATLAVAKPTVEGGVLKSLQTTKVDASLQVDGTVNAANTDLLRLIAPSARLGGNVKGGQQVSMILGNNTVDAVSGQATAGTALVNTDRRYDSTLFGAMQAGRISVLSTAAGVGVNLDAAQLNATDIELTADQLNIRGKVSDSTVKDYHSHTNWWNWGRAGREYLDIDETDKRQSMTRSQLNATGTLTVKANDSLNINAADLNGKDANLAGKNVNLNTQATTDSYRYYYRDAINWWSYQKTESRDVTTQHGARINASGQLNLDAEQNASLTGAQLASTHGNVRFNVGNDLLLNAAVNRDLRSYTENEVNNTIINNSTTSNNYDNRTLLASRVDANQALALDAGHDLTLNAAQLKSGGSTLLSASGALTVDAQSYQTSQSASSVYSNTGGLFGGSDTSSGVSKTLYQGSDLQAGGTTYLTADGDVRVRGSRVKATNGVYAVSRNGGIGIDVAKGQTLTQTSGSTQTVFNITTNSGSSQTQQQIVTGSDLHSDASISLISATDTAIIGSLLNAAGDIGISAAGGLSIANTTTQTTTTSTGSVTDGYATGSATTSEAQYQGSVGIQTVTTTGTTTTSTVTGSTLQSGGDTTLSAEQTVAVSGSTVQSSGGLNVSGSDIAVTAAQSTISTSATTSTVGGGLYAGAGVEGVNAGVEVNSTATTTDTTSSTAEVSSLSASGDITRTADGTITDQGTTLIAGGTATTQATTIDSLAASNTTTSTTTTDSTHVEVGVEANTGVGNAAYEVVSGVVATGQVSMPTSEVSAPGVGPALAVSSSTSTATANTSSAVVSTVLADDINTSASGNLTLEGTQLSADNNVSLNAGGDILLTAATDSQAGYSYNEGGSGEVSVGMGFVPAPTVTSVTVSADYQQTETRSLDTQAITGNINGGNNVQVSSGGDLVTTSTVSAGGDATLSAGGDLVQATNQDTTFTRTETVGAGGDVSLSLSDGNVQGGSTNLYLQATDADQRSTTVSNSLVTAGGTVNLNAGDELVQQSEASTATSSSHSTDASLTLSDVSTVSGIAGNIGNLVDGQLPLTVVQTESNTQVITQ